jgi:hypothetical protein
MISHRELRNERLVEREDVTPILIAAVDRFLRRVIALSSFN